MQILDYFENNPEYLLLLGLLLVTFWLINNLVKRQRRRRSGVEPTSRQQVERNRQLQGMQGRLEQLMVEIEQMAKRLAAQLDAKAMHLEKLLEEADAKARELQQLSRPTEAPIRPAAAVRQAVAQHAHTAPLIDGDSTDSSDPLAATIYELADAGLDAASIAKQLDEHVGKVELILALRES